MKKTILSLIAITSAAISYGQVNVDWSVDEVLKPTQLNSTASGTNVPLDIVLKNNGTDSAKIGDSVFISFYVAIGSTAYIYYPSSNLLIVSFYQKLTKNMKSGDTMHFTNNNFQSLLKIYPSANATFRFTSILLNRSRGLGYEQAGTSTNNSKTTNLVWYNEQGWPVSVANVEPTTVQLYPNIASNFVTIKPGIVDVSSPIKVKLYDISGNLVQVSNFVSTTELTMDLTKVSNGTYMVVVESGSIVKQSKLVVLK